MAEEPFQHHFADRIALERIDRKRQRFEVDDDFFDRFGGELFKQCVTLVTKLYQFYWEKDCAMVEVNPLLVTKEGKLITLDFNTKTKVTELKESQVKMGDVGIGSSAVVEYTTKGEKNFLSKMEFVPAKGE